VRIVTRWEIQNKSIVLRACSKFSCSISTDNEIANFFVRTNKILQLMEISFGSWKADVGKQISFRKKKKNLGWHFSRSIGKRLITFG
jgi:hypothetical protein